jgi:hypothetical protein
VFLHAGIKFTWSVFFTKDSGLRPPDPPLNKKAALALFAFLLLPLTKRTLTISLDVDGFHRRAGAFAVGR